MHSDIWLVGTVIWVALAGVGIIAYAKGAQRALTRSILLFAGLLVVAVFYHLSGRGSTLLESVVGAPVFFFTATFSLLYGVGLDISGM